MGIWSRRPCAQGVGVDPCLLNDFEKNGRWLAEKVNKSKYPCLKNLAQRRQDDPGFRSGYGFPVHGQNFSVTQRGAQERGSKCEQTQANADKGGQTQANAEVQTQANASKREQTWTNANKRLHPPLLRFFSTPLKKVCNPLSIDVSVRAIRIRIRKRTNRIADFNFFGKLVNQ